MSEINSAGLPIYRSALEAGWIDYNGHLRDAYYGVIFSSAIDDLMDRLGLDAGYRSATKNTLFTLEMHVYFLHEVKHDDAVHVLGGVVGSDRKRIHAGFALYGSRHAEPSATAEFMLLHVHQGTETRAVSFSDGIRTRVEQLQGLTEAHAPLGAASRKIQLR